MNRDIQVNQVTLDKIPTRLSEYNNWVAWRLDPPAKPGGKSRKIPVDPNTGKNASTTDPQTWGTFKDAVAYAKLEILAELERQRNDRTIPWMLEEWRRISIPAWRRILIESIYGKDMKREDYARWMLREVLEDDEYQETDR